MSQQILAVPLDELPHATASDVKKAGWRGMMKTVRGSGSIVITNHSEPEAVIMGIDEYEKIIDTVQQAGFLQQRSDVLEQLGAKFDAFVASLNTGDAFDKAVASPPESGRKIKISQSL